MTEMGIWFLAITLLTSGLLLVFFLLGRRLDPRGADLTLVRDVIQFASIVLNIVAIAVAVGAIQMAANRYRETKEAGQKIQEELAASRKSLENVVATAQTQHALLVSNLADAKTQFDLIAEQRKQLSETQVAAPVAAPIAATTPAAAPLVGLLYADSEVNSLPTPIEIKQGGEFTRITFSIRNTGRAPAEKGVVVAIADPPTVLIDRADGRMEERRSLHRFESMISDIRPYTSAQDDYTLQLDLHGVIPADFVLSINIFGENFEAVRRKISFRVSE
jgi:hypothetical protein